MRRLILSTTALVAASALTACGGGSSPTPTTPTTPTSSSGDPGAMQTGTPGSGGTWSGQLGPVDMPPGPYVAPPASLPTSVEGWHASRGATATRATYLPSGTKGDAPGIAVELHDSGQPNLRGGNDGVVDEMVYCEPAGGSAADRCAVPFDGGYLTLRAGQGMTDTQVAALGNALYEVARG